MADIFPSEDMRRFVQRAVGYSLLGDTGEQCFFICWGSGANGKSTFLNTLLRTIGGDYAMQADPQSFMATRSDRIRNDLADLRGVRFLSAIETGDGKRLDEAVVKQATGGDLIRARHLYCEAFQFRPEFKLWLATNHRPTIRGTDHAIWRRVRLIPFDVTIDESKRDPGLDEKLFRETEGILDWAVNGAVDFIQHGLQPPAEVISATEEYRHAEDIIEQFLAECTGLSKYETTPATQLFERFREFGGTGMSQTAFGRQLSERGFDRITRNGRIHYIGLTLLPG